MLRRIALADKGLKASQLLDATSLRIGAVSEAVGYNDPLYFSRVFKKVTGLSPREYRSFHKK